MNSLTWGPGLYPLIQSALVGLVITSVGLLAARGHQPWGWLAPCLLEKGAP
jgi:hypothetical protein